MTTTYGTIPTAASDSSSDIISKAKERVQSSLGARRPWAEMMEFESLNLPATFNESVQRIKTNAELFRANYAILVSFILLFSLLWHPFTLIALTAMTVAWSFLYFLREDPLMVFGLEIYDKIVMAFLLFTTFIVFYLTNVTDNIVVGLFIGVMVILVHGSLRNSEDVVFLDDYEEGFGSAAPLHRHENVQLKIAASSSFVAS